MFYFEKRHFRTPVILDRTSHFYPMTLLFLTLIITYPVVSSMISVGLIFLFQYKLHSFLSKDWPTYKPEPGDILLFFSHKSADIPEWVYWDGILTLHTNVPIKHVGNVLDEKYFVECRHPEFPKYDNMTKSHTHGIPRLAKFKYIYDDWNTGDIMIIKTGQTINDEKRKKILENFNKKSYWPGGGCIGHFNSTQKLIDETAPTFLSVESILKHYKDAKIGRLEI